MMSVRRNSLWLVSLIGAVMIFSTAPAMAAWDLNLTEGVTPISHDVYDLHMVILWICTIIGIGVFGVMFYSIMQHRKSKGAVPATFHESTTVELAWTVIPFLILIGMAIPATKTLIAMEDTGESDMTVKITGYQWKWGYEYLDEDISFYSNLHPDSRAAIYGDPSSNENYLLEVDNQVVLPVGKKIRFLLTADDVIHNWWVPALGTKRDAVPGFINELWATIQEPGIYRGQCAELCGKDHGFMPIVVKAVPQAEYDAWVKSMKGAVESAAVEAERDWSKDELYTKGEEVYNTVCAACHQANGEGMGSTFPPIKGSAIATGPVEGHMDIVMNGKSGTAMAAFGAQLGDVDLAAVLTYQRNAFGNDVGDMVQPSAIKNARN